VIVAAVGGAENVALLAAEILALSDDVVRARLVAFRERQARAILDDETNRPA
jgi:phosphoribosylcarboxyaminoimidazole (NCAIR) mutase